MKFHIQGSNNNTKTATYATIKDSIVQKIQKTSGYGHDVAESLQNMQKKNLLTYVKQ